MEKSNFQCVCENLDTWNDIHIHKCCYFVIHTQTQILFKRFFYSIEYHFIRNTKIAQNFQKLNKQNQSNILCFHIEISLHKSRISIEMSSHYFSLAESLFFDGNSLCLCENSNCLMFIRNRNRFTQLINMDGDYRPS